MTVSEDFVTATTCVSRMRVGDLGYVAIGAIHHLSLWNRNCMRKGSRATIQRTADSDVQIRRVSGGWEAMLAEGQLPQVMPAPDPGSDWYEYGEVFLVKSTDQ